jgi:hypothetical protein
LAENRNVTAHKSKLSLGLRSSDSGGVSVEGSKASRTSVLFQSYIHFCFLAVFFYVLNLFG